MISLGELRLPATLENLRTVSHFINAIGQRLKLTEKALFDLELAVEEATTNIVRHAYPPDQPGDMQVAIIQRGPHLFVRLTDWGQPLDPEDVKPFDLNAPVEARIQGGMGLFFINTLMDSVTRHTATQPGEPNTLVLQKTIEYLQPGEEPANPLRDLNAMLNVSRVLGTTTDLDRLLSLILEELVESIHAERGTLYLIDEEHGELVSRKLAAGTEALKVVRAKIGEGIAGTVAQTGQVLNIEDAVFDRRYDSSVDAKTGYLTRTILAAPMRNPQQKVIGVVQVLNKKGDGPFTVRDERLLTAMAAQAAISIENARLYEQELQQQLLNQELDTARAIQKSFMPHESPRLEGWDTGMFWTPMREVAGDFYDFFTLADGRTAFVVADVSGKGIPAAMFMALSQTVLRFAMSLNLPPAEMMARTNRFILDYQRSRMFVTAFVGYLRPETGEFAYASAGHNPPMHYRAATGEIAYLEVSGVALGVFREAAFDNGRCEIARGDVIVLYTDGVTEAINQADEEFGEERLAAVIREMAGRGAQEIASAIVKAVALFTQGRGVFDDETLLVLKRG